MPSRLSRAALAAVVAGWLLALSGCFGDDDGPGPPREPTASAPAPPQADVHVTADLGAPISGGPSMSGFLHGLRDGSPPDSAIRPLRPRLWRSIPSRVPYARATALGARYQLVLSDLWGYPAGGWHDRGPPWRDLAAWGDMVRRTARSLRGHPVEWDVWNEPDNEVFWTGTREQFFRVYETAARALEDELGDTVVVGGPSTTKPRAAWLEGLLRHCRARGCRVSFLSFHANLEADEPIPALESDLRAVRALVPRYRDLSLTGVEVNESIGPADQYRPGEILGYLEHMEAGGADAAARSCWLDLAGADNCLNGTLEGLLTPEGRPRSAWWAYRAYAEGQEGRVPGSSDSAAVAVLASRRTVTGGAQVLLARHDRADPAAPPVSVALTLRGLAGALPGARRAVVTLELLSDTGEQPLDAPPVVGRRTIAVGSGDVTLPVGQLGHHQALVVRVAP